MKKQKDTTPEDQPSSPEQAPEETPQGVRWLRYAGVGPVRKSAGKSQGKKISGANVTSLGSLEAELMGLLWEMGRPANPMEVAEVSLYRRRSQSQEPVAFATVNTTLRRLADKGLLLTEKHETRTPYYTPTVGREEMAARILNNVSVTLLGQTLHAMLPRLAGTLGPQKVTKDAAEQESLNRLLQTLEDEADKKPGTPAADPE